MKNKPSISVVIPTYNSEKTLSSCLESVRMQAYPKAKIEIILADGGSSDSTFSIAKKYNAKVVKVNEKDKQGPEFNRAVGAHKAKGEILLFIDHDNELPHEDWINNMVRPLVDDETIVGSYTQYYFYDKNDSLLGRYFSLFGVNDILPLYLGKADRLSYIYADPRQYGVYKMATIKEKKKYYTITFDKHHIPTLGSNGFMVRRTLLFAHADVDVDNFFHIDVHVDLIKKGFHTYAMIKDTHMHKTDDRGILDFLKRRVLFIELYHFGEKGLSMKSNRRYSVYESKDMIKLIYTVVISLTLVKPIVDSVRGYIKKPDIAWFVHPVMCVGIVISYGLGIMKHVIKSRL